MKKKGKVFIVKNNLKLNIFLNMFFLACLTIVFVLEWYIYSVPYDETSVKLYEI